MTVPPIALSPTLLATGMASPVTMLSSTSVLPLTMTPSHGMVEPGSTLTQSPLASRSASISVPAPVGSLVSASSSTKMAVLALRSISLYMASEVLPLARDSRYLPPTIKVISSAGVSKNCGASKEVSAMAQMVDATENR